MEIENIWVIALMIVVIPLFFWMRVSSINKRKKGVTVRCPHCEKDQRLEKLRNYVCEKCDTSVAFFDEQGDPLKEITYYECMACQEKNFMGILTCTACGMANKAGIPK
jgi:DNA-directed RNA polymerase subunit RPC12/RpoP